MHNDRFSSAVKISFIVSVLLGIAFLLVGLAQVFLSTGDESSKLNLCLFAVDALLGMAVIFFGFCLNAFFRRFYEYMEKIEEANKTDEGL